MDIMWRFVDAVSNANDTVGRRYDLMPGHSVPAYALPRGEELLLRFIHVGLSVKPRYLSHVDLVTAGHWFKHVQTAAQWICTSLRLVRRFRHVSGTNLASCASHESPI